jgi:hypothetical protein
MVPRYNLIRLGWYNFEMLSKSLLKLIIGPGVSSFGGTQDKGRDATYEGKASFPSKVNPWDGFWIFQVKSKEVEKLETRTQINSFYRNLEKEFLNIKEKHEEWPDNYILILNFSISAKTKDDLKKRVLNLGFDGNFHTIDGQEICEFLDIYPQIRRAYPQLIGLADLEHIINRELYEKSKAFFETWQEKLSCFVAVKPYFTALEKIKKYNFIVLDGPPEVGKSFIGAAISLFQSTEGYEVYYIDKPTEIFRLIDSEKKQIFFADDAVGSILFDHELGKYWGKHLPLLLRRLDVKHKLIWTTRTYILKDAIAETKLDEDIHNFPSVFDVLVEIQNYSLEEKALILYNHAKQSSLPRNIKDFIKKYAIRICSNNNITPERTRQLIDNVIVELFNDDEVYDDETILNSIITFLNNPGERFKHAYDALGASEKELLLTLLDAGTAVEKNDLEEDYERRVLRL